MFTFSHCEVRRERREGYSCCGARLSIGTVVGATLAALRDRTLSATGVRTESEPRIISDYPQFASLECRIYAMLPQNRFMKIESIEDLIEASPLRLLRLCAGDGKSVLILHQEIV